MYKDSEERRKRKIYDEGKESFKEWSLELSDSYVKQWATVNRETRFACEISRTLAHKKFYTFSYTRSSYENVKSNDKMLCKKIDHQLPRSFFPFIKHWLISISHHHIKFFSLCCALHLPPLKVPLKRNKKKQTQEKRMKQLFFSTIIIIGSLHDVLFYVFFDIKHFEENSNVKITCRKRVMKKK